MGSAACTLLLAGNNCHCRVVTAHNFHTQITNKIVIESKYGHVARRKFIDQLKDSIPNSICTISDAEETIIRRDRAPTDEFVTNNCYFELE